MTDDELVEKDHRRVDGHAIIQFTLLVVVVGIVAMSFGMLIFNSGNQSLGSKIVLASAFATLLPLSAVVWRVFR